MTEADRNSHYYGKSAVFQQLKRLFDGVILQCLFTSRAEAQQRMFQKLVNPGFFTDMGPLLPTDLAKALTEETLKAAFSRVMKELIDRMSGDEWAKAGEMRKRFGL